MQMHTIALNTKTATG